MKKIKTLITIILIVTGLIAGCSKDPGQPGNNQGAPPAENCDGVNAKFTTDILPLIQTMCATNAGCHGNGSGNGPGPLTSFNEIKNAAVLIKIAVVSGRMPLGGSLSSAQKRQISCWVDNGANND